MADILMYGNEQIGVAGPADASELPYDNATSTKGAIESITYVSGASGNWKWKKYNDGTFELWNKTVTTETLSTNAWGGVYAFDIQGVGNYPFSIDSITFINGTAALSDTNTACNITYIYNLTTAPNYLLVRGTAVASKEVSLLRTLYLRGTYH